MRCFSPTSASRRRPRCSNDNAFIEAHFKTLKYQPTFPERFASLQEARAFCQVYFQWYNDEHRHSGMAMLPPASVHHGKADTILAKRQTTLDAAFKQNPHRFVRGTPKVRKLPAAVYINPPEVAA